MNSPSIATIDRTVYIAAAVINTRANSKPGSVVISNGYLYWNFRNKQMLLKTSCQQLYFFFELHRHKSETSNHFLPGSQLIEYFTNWYHRGKRNHTYWRKKYSYRQNMRPLCDAKNKFLVFLSIF